MQSHRGAALLLACVFILASQQASAWTWSSHASNSAPKVSGHACSAAADDRILLFGGLTGSAGSPTTADLWIYNKNNENNDIGWAMIPKLEQGISRPTPRMYAASAVLDNSLFLIGGWNPGEPGSGGIFLDDVWRLSLKSMKWDRVEVMLPYPVSRHTACTVGSDTIAIQTHKGLLLLSSDGRDWSISEQPTTGEGPDGLSMCASTILGDDSGRMLIKMQELSSAAFVLDAKSWTWKKLQSKEGGDAPHPLASPCAAFAGDNQCVIFGGAMLGSEGYAGGLVPQDDTWLCTIEDDLVGWQRIATEGDSPGGLVAASLAAIGDELILQGGWDPVSKETYDQTWVLKKK